MIESDKCEYAGPDIWYKNEELVGSRIADSPRPSSPYDCASQSHLHITYLHQLRENAINSDPPSTLMGGAIWRIKRRAAESKAIKTGPKIVKNVMYSFISILLAGIPELAAQQTYVYIQN